MGEERGVVEPFPKTVMALQLKQGVKLFDIVKKLPGLGIGRTVTRVTWPPQSYWKIVEVKPKVDGKSGKVWGYKVWKGKRVCCALEEKKSMASPFFSYSQLSSSSSSE